MTNITLSFNCSTGAAFEDFGQFEIARIFNELAKKAEDGYLDGDLTLPIYDINGNKIGKLEIN